METRHANHRPPRVSKKVLSRSRKSVWARTINPQIPSTGAPVAWSMSSNISSHRSPLMGSKLYKRIVSLDSVRANEVKG